MVCVEAGVSPLGEVRTCGPEREAAIIGVAFANDSDNATAATSIRVFKVISTFCFLLVQRATATYTTVRESDCDAHTASSRTAQQPEEVSSRCCRLFTPWRKVRGIPGTQKSGLALHVVAPLPVNQKRGSLFTLILAP